jgi:hypothetical protein
MQRSGKGRFEHLSCFRDEMYKDVKKYCKDVPYEVVSKSDNTYENIIYGDFSYFVVPDKVNISSFRFKARKSFLGLLS